MKRSCKKTIRDTAHPSMSRRIASLILSFTLSIGIMASGSVLPHPVSHSLMTEALAETALATGVQMDIDLGKTATFSFPIEFDAEPSWYSQDPAIAQIQSSGIDPGTWKTYCIVEGVSKGSTKIILRFTSSKTYTEYAFDVTVNDAASSETQKTEKLSFPKDPKATTSKVLSAGSRLQLKIPGVSASKAKWSSSKKSIATVSKKGLVKTKKEGICVIKAKYKKKTWQCRIIVRKAAEGSDGTAEGVPGQPLL